MVKWNWITSTYINNLKCIVKYELIWQICLNCVFLSYSNHLFMALFQLLGWWIPSSQWSQKIARLWWWISTWNLGPVTTSLESRTAMVSFEKTQSGPPLQRFSPWCHTQSTLSASCLLTAVAAVSPLLLWLERQVWLFTFSVTKKYSRAEFLDPEWVMLSPGSSECLCHHSTWPAEVTWSALLFTGFYHNLNPVSVLQMQVCLTQPEHREPSGPLIVTVPDNSNIMT